MQKTTSFEYYANQVRIGAPKRVALACAEDHHALEAIFRARDEGLVAPILVGVLDDIASALADLGIDYGGEIIPAENKSAAAETVVTLAASGSVDFIMKGKMDTSDLLRAVVSKNGGLNTGRLMSHVAFCEIPSYHKLALVTDGGMIPHPTFEQKVGIVQNAVEVMHRLGTPEPSVAILCGLEKVNPKMPETVEAAELKRMNLAGEIVGCRIEGPISMDLAIDRESAVIKGFECDDCGDFDVLVTPDLASGNILGKSVTLFGGAKLAGFIVGAKVPVVLSSRGASAEEKYLSIVIAAAASV